MVRVSFPPLSNNFDINETYKKSVSIDTLFFLGSLTPPRCLLVQNLYEILFLLLSYRLSKYAPSQKKRLSYDFATKPLRYSTIRRLLALWAHSLRLVAFYHRRWFSRLGNECTALRPTLIYLTTRYGRITKQAMPACDFATKPLRYSTIRRLLALWANSLRLVEFYHQRWFRSRQRRFSRHGIEGESINKSLPCVKGGGPR